MSARLAFDLKDDRLVDVQIEYRRVGADGVTLERLSLGPRHVLEWTRQSEQGPAETLTGQIAPEELLRFLMVLEASEFHAIAKRFTSRAVEPIAHVLRVDIPGACHTVRVDVPTQPDVAFEIAAGALLAVVYEAEPRLCGKRILQ